MHELKLSGLRVRVEGQPDDLLRGIDLTIRSGEIHALMGPNGSGKTTLANALMGRPGYLITGGSVSIDGKELNSLPTWQRAAAGLFVAMQYPVELPGVRLVDFFAAAMQGQDHPVHDLPKIVTTEAARLGIDESFLHRAVNVEFSGGEKKRNETLQLAVLKPKFAILDEIDSGLDVDALREISQRIQSMVQETDLGVLAITHYARLLKELKPDHVHVLMDGHIVASGGAELADTLEKSGYEGLAESLGVEFAVTSAQQANPFADPLA